MTSDERKVLEDAEAQVFDSMQALQDAQQTTGIRPPPTIEETETTLDLTWFGFEFGEQPQAISQPGSSVPVEFDCTADITVTFHDLLFDCGCLIDEGGAGQIVTDINLNGRSKTLNQWITSCTGGVFPSACLWKNDADWDAPLPLHYAFYGTNDCSGSPVEESDIGPIVRVMLNAGRWYVFAWFTNGVGTAAIFIGDGTNPSSIPNSMFCRGNTDPGDPWTNELVVCQNGPFTIPGYSHDGFVSIAF